MRLSNCAVCDSKKSKFLKEEEAIELWATFNSRKILANNWT